MEHCYICGRRGVEIHHIFFGSANRKVSDKCDFIVPLCPEHHRGTKGVHGKDGLTLNMFLKRTAQKCFEETDTREEFIQLFGKSWL